jgi:hypothetical protein
MRICHIRSNVFAILSSLGARFPVFMRMQSHMDFHPASYVVCLHRITGDDLLIFGLVINQSSFSACYDNQVTFEMHNGDGLLTSAFIHCMRENEYKVSYAELIAQMKRFFIRNNEARSSQRLVEPPFPVLSSSYPMDLATMVEI